MILEVEIILWYCCILMLNIAINLVYTLDAPNTQHNINTYRAIHLFP
jgi:hypothetical protein